MSVTPILEHLDKTRKVTRKTIMAAGNFTPDTALYAVENKLADIKLLGRGLIAGPDFCNKFCEGNASTRSATATNANSQMKSAINIRPPARSVVLLIS